MILGSVIPWIFSESPLELIVILGNKIRYKEKGKCIKLHTNKNGLTRVKAGQSVCKIEGVKNYKSYCLSFLLPHEVIWLTTGVKNLKYTCTFIETSHELIDLETTYLSILESYSDISPTL